MKKVISLLLSAMLIVGSVVSVLSAKPELNVGAEAELVLHSESSDVEAYPTRGFKYVNVYTGIMDNNGRGFLEEVEIDGLPALKAFPNKETDNDGAFVIDNYSLAGKIGNIDLDVYKYITIIYKYEGTRHTTKQPGLYIGTHSGEIAGGAYPEHVSSTEHAKGWTSSIYKIPDLTDKYQTPDIIHNLNHFHLIPFGQKRKEDFVSEVPADAVIYIQGIAFSKELPEKISLSVPYIDPKDDSIFGTSLPFTRADACVAVARLIGNGADSYDGETEFPDLSGDHPSYGSIVYCESMGYLTAFGGEIKPDEPIKRGELLDILIKAYINYCGSELPRTALSSYPQDATVSRAQASSLINTVFGVDTSDVPENIGCLFEDVGNSFWASDDIATAAIPHTTVIEQGKTQEKWMYYPDILIDISDDVLEKGIQKLSEVETLEEDRIYEIRNTLTDVNVSGKAYFFAEHGNDQNSGLTPDSPKKTLSALSELTLKHGDGVFFNRGDTFRGSIKAVAGVTYSAYGEGEKPIISMSPANFAGASNWVATDTPNVYMLTTPVENDVGLIVFDGGKAWSEKRIKGRSDFVEGKLEDLDKDLTMWHDLAIPTDTSGYVYLRSDLGNPGERFDSIEMSPRKNVITAASDIVVDNLHITNTGAHGVGSGDVKNLTVQNCEFSWIGGSWFRTDTLSRYGNAVEVYGGCDGYTVENCYIWQVYDAGVTHQLTQSPERECIMKDIRYVNNVITDTSYPVEYFIAQANEGVNHLMQNVEISGNIIMRTGLGFGDQRPDKDQASAIKGWDSYNLSENFVYRNNIFALSKYRILQIGVGDNSWLPEFCGNTYIQYANADFGNIGNYGRASYNAFVGDYIREYSRDETAEVYFVPDPLADTE